MLRLIRGPPISSPALQSLIEVEVWNGSKLALIFLIQALESYPSFFHWMKLLGAVMITRAKGFTKRRKAHRISCSYTTAGTLTGLLQNIEQRLDS